MGRRGPPPKPSATKKREGTFRKDRAATKEPTPDPGIPKCPAWIAKDKDAKPLWDQLAPHLLKLGLLTIVDGTALEGLCRAYSTATKADRELKKLGIVVMTMYGPKANPAIVVSRTAWSQVRQFAAEFGLTPASRSRVNADPPADPNRKQDDVEDALFGKVVGSIGRA